MITRTLLLLLLGIFACTGKKPDSGIGEPPPPAKDDTSPQSPTPGETLGEKPADETSLRPNPADQLIDQNLSATSRLCQDPMLGKDGLEVCFNGKSRLLSPFDSIELQLTLKRSRGILEQISEQIILENISIEDSEGNKHPIRAYWQGDRSVIIDPVKPLLSNMSYLLKVSSESGQIGRPISDKGRVLQPFRFSFDTPSPFAMSHSVNGLKMDSKRGMILDNQSLGFENLVLESLVTDARLASTISIRRLASRDWQILCDNNCIDKLTVPLEASLSPKEGLNSYIYRITPKEEKQKPIYHHLSFIWGRLAKDPYGSSRGGIRVAADEKNALRQLSGLLNQYGDGQFTLDYIDESGELREKSSLNDIIRSKLRRYSTGPSNDCMDYWGRDFDYIEELGPFCGIKVKGKSKLVGGLLGDVQFEASTDVFVTAMEVVEKADNLNIRFKARKDYMDLSMGVKEFKGRLRILVHIEKAKHALGFTVHDALGTFAFDTEFHMNSELQLETLAKAGLIQENGMLNLNINGIESFDLDRPINGNPNGKKYFNTDPWNRATEVRSPKLLDKATGPWTAIVNMVIQQAVGEKIDEFKPGIVNGIARDMIQIIAPNALNGIVRQLQKGLNIPAPEYLPAPLNDLGATVKGTIIGQPRLRKGYLHLDLDGSLAFLDTGKAEPTKSPIGIDSYPVLGDENYTPPLPTKGPMTAKAGALISLDVNILNQFLYQAWHQGLLNLSLNKQFVDEIESIAKFDPQNAANGKEILFAAFIPKLMGKTVDRMITEDADGNMIVMNRDDAITLNVQALLPPFIQNSAPPNNSDDYYLPDLKLELGDFLVSIKGHRDGQTYNIATLRMALSSKSQLSFRPYSNPYYQKRFSGVGALSLNVLSDLDSLDYAIEVLEDPENNPFGINATKLENAVSDMVDTLFVPLVNDAMGDFPLAGLRSCGIELDVQNMELLPISSRANGHYFRLKAPLKSYPFTGNCSLEPDKTSPLPPLPPRPDPDPNDPDLPPSGDLSKGFDMDFSSLPFHLGKPGKIPEIHKDCKNNIFFEPSCAAGQVNYLKNPDGSLKLDPRGRPVYDNSYIQLSALVSKDKYSLRYSDGPSIEEQFFSFNRWGEYVKDARTSIIMHDSQTMPEVETPSGEFQRHYADYETNSPKASGFIPIRNVTYHRILETAAPGAEITTEFFVNLSSYVEVPGDRPSLQGAEGLDYHVGKIHVVDCGSLDWCGDDRQWLVIYDSLIRPEDKSIPEDVFPYLKTALNAIITGMFSNP